MIGRTHHCLRRTIVAYYALGLLKKWPSGFSVHAIMNDNLFIESAVAKDHIYNIIRDDKDEPYIVEVKSFVEQLWQQYQPFADTDFRQKIQEDFHARFWEMYLTCAFLDHTLPVRTKTNKNRGPDIMVDHPTHRIWVEAIAPTSGAEDNPDRVPDPQHGVATRVPDEQITLRYRSAISEKFDNKYRKYLATGVVSPSDAYVIAINSCKIRAARSEIDPPRIVKAVFPIGYPQVTISTDTMGIVDRGFQIRPAIGRTSGLQVTTDLFLNPAYENLSGVMYSRASVNNLVRQLGEDFIFIHNPLARNPVQLGFFKIGREYTAHAGLDGYTITYRDWNAGTNGKQEKERQS